MKNLLFALLISLTVFVLLGCGEVRRESAFKMVNEGEGLLFHVDTTKIIRNGQRFYIPLNFSGSPDANANEILGVLDDLERNFKKANPPMKIVSWKIEKRQEIGSRNGVSAFVYGLWVDCELITEKFPKN
ncbi:MAG: hypothetical protein QMD50_01865 [Patescibacteria group bacterium]|nr:hypothetical protein [Patescibacteria group bacterium]